MASKLLASRSNLILQFFLSFFIDCRSPLWASSGRLWKPAVNRQPGFRRRTRRAEQILKNKNEDILVALAFHQKKQGGVRSTLLVLEVWEL